MDYLPESPPVARHDDSPEVSVVMCNWRGAKTLSAAIAAVLRQSCVNLEVIVADDASDDESCQIVEAIAMRDPRVRLLKSQENRGAAAARNRALDVSRGRWVAIVDSDDIIHPLRIARMLAAAERYNVDILVDDMVPFGTDQGIGGSTLFGGIAKGEPRRIDITGFVQSDLSRSLGSLGYSKPMIRRSALGAVRYDETVAIGEDFDFCARLLMNGLTFLLWPDPTYLYRRHAASLSHRLSVDDLQRQISAHDRLAAKSMLAAPDLSAVFAERRQMLDRALQYESLVEAIKARRLVASVGQLMRKPALVVELARSLRERRQRQRAGVQMRRTDGVKVCLVAQGVTPPAGEGRVVLTVPPMPVDAPATAHAELAGKLAALYGAGPLDVTVVGADALVALGYLPDTLRVAVELLPDEVLSDPATLPPLDEVRLMS
jgi:succinoglycan biosynthesis protein ExoO